LPTTVQQLVSGPECLGMHEYMPAAVTTALDSVFIIENYVVMYLLGPMY